MNIDDRVFSLVMTMMTERSSLEDTSEVDLKNFGGYSCPLSSKDHFKLAVVLHIRRWFRIYLALLLFQIAIPEYLRSNEQLIFNLKNNARRHTSQYDIYATLYDIAHYAKKDGYRNWDEHDFRFIRPIFMKCLHLLIDKSLFPVPFCSASVLKLKIIDWP